MRSEPIVTQYPSYMIYQDGDENMISINHYQFFHKYFMMHFRQQIQGHHQLFMMILDYILV